MRIRITALFLIIALLASVCGCTKADKQDETDAGHHQTERDETTLQNQTDNTVASTSKAGENGETVLTNVDNTGAQIVQPVEETAETIEGTVPLETDTSPAPDEDNESLTPQQASSIAMLHYLSTVSQEIESAKGTQNSRLLLEDVYSSLLNNVTAVKIDSTTQEYLNDLLIIIEKYRMIAIKRDRLKVLYDQDKASLIRNAVPNPLSILSITNAKDWKALVSSVVYTAVDSYNRYKTAESELDKQFMISGWELDDEEAANIHDNRLKAFNYMLDIVRNNGLPERFRLTEKDIIDFVENTNSDNLYDKIQFLKRYEPKYSSFGSYWLELADCYYEQGQYKQCVDCVWSYESLQTGYLATGIFDKDHAYAELLPKAIVSAQQVYAGESYVEIISGFTDALTNNASDENWALQYFAAQSFVDLYSRTQDESYLEKAYEIVKNNVRLLKKEQVALNSTYLGALEELKLEDMPDDWYLSESKKEKLEKQRKEEQKNLML